MLLQRSKIRDIIQGFKSPSSVVTSTCLQPHFTLVYDPVLSRFVWQNVRCGRCENCQAHTRNEWVTRMCLHALSYKYCYFVTLTFGSYDLTVFERHPFFDDWLLTYPVRDRFNKNRGFKYSPSILRPELLVKFIKRLRKNTGADISYCGCGEYGSKYNESGSKIHGSGFGRPHFHLIIYSQQELKRQDILDAWSLQCVAITPDYIVKDNGKYNNTYQHFRFPIGRIDFQDLRPELNWNGVPERSSSSAKRCFNYVAKYVCNRDEICPAALLRIKRTFLRLELCDDYYNENYTLPKDFNDKIDNYRKYTRNSISYEKINFDKFKSLCAPFFVCSRKKAIGKRYCMERIEDFKRGNFALPQFNGSILEFPSYFHRLSSLVSYPLRLVSFGEKSISLIKSSLPFLREAYQDLAAIVSPVEFTETFDVYSVQYRQLFNKAHHPELFKGTIMDIVLCDPRVSNIRYKYDDYLDVFNGYVYDIHTKKYALYHSFPRFEFMTYLVNLIDKEIERYHLSMASLWREEENKIFELIKEDPVCHELVKNFKILNRSQQEKYAAEHQLFNDNQ